MRPILLYKAVWLFLLFAVSGCRSGVSANEAGEASVRDSSSSEQPTVIYFVRHAEKDTSDPKNEDPDLTVAGKERATAFRDLLKGQTIDALYATKYRRTQHTLKPLSEERQLQIREYSSNDFQGLRQRILQEHEGGTIVVAGHSNTLLPLVEAFGAKRPVVDILESEYFYLFKVVVDPENRSTVELSRYGH